MRAAFGTVGWLASLGSALVMGMLLWACHVRSGTDEERYITGHQQRGAEMWHTDGDRCSEHCMARMLFVEKQGEEMPKLPSTLEQDTTGWPMVSRVWRAII